MPLTQQLLTVGMITVAFLAAALQAMWSDDFGGGGGGGGGVGGGASTDGYLRDSRWWGLHRYAYHDKNWDVRQAQYHFSKKQWSHFAPRKCNFDPEMVRASLHGVHMALRECERQMAGERWNCSRFASNYNYGQPNIFGKLMWRGIPETSFALAIVSAGLTASIATECKRSLTCCPCHMSSVSKFDGPANSITHAGCDHNIKFAKSFAKRLLDKSEKGRDIRYLTMLHNYNTGRRAVVKTMVKKCLCHGTSGSCTYRTCWKEVAGFQKIGEHLKRQYERAVKVMRGSPVKIYTEPLGPSAVADSQKRRRRRLNLVKVEGSVHGLAHPKKSDLVYYETVSRDFFCERQTYWSVLGTRHRVCSAHSGSCGNICCGRPYRTEYYKHVDTKCNCRFIWCCEVKCETCITDRQRQICS